MSESEAIADRMRSEIEVSRASVTEVFLVDLINRFPSA